MNSLMVSIRIDDIVDAVYPNPAAMRERYILTQSLYQLVSLALREQDRNEEVSAARLRLLISNVMYGEIPHNGTQTDRKS